MRIALIAPPWLPVPPPRYGGTEGVVDQLARGFLAAGHDMLLCATGDSTAPVATHATFPRARPESVGLLLPELRHVLDAYEVARDADIVHDHTLIGPHVAGATCPPVVVTHHGPFDDDLAPVLAAASRRATVVAISAAQARRAWPGTVHRIIHHGLDTDEVPVGSGRGGYLAFLGRCSPSKGMAQAIDIARTAGVPLRIAAKCREPAEHAYFDGVVRPRLGHGVEYLGELGWHDKLALLGEALALVNPIQWEEPFGLVMVEALASGTPVLTLARGAAPEIVDDGVTGFVARDESHLVRLVARAPELDRRACRAAAVRRFSAARMVSDHLDLYDEILDGTTGRTPTVDRVTPMSA